MGWIDRLSAAWDALSRAPGPASGTVGGATGGPATADAWRFRRGPTRLQLVESYRQAVYACVEINAAVISAVPLRLYATTARGQARPRSYCGPRPADRLARAHLGSLPYAARAMAAADEVDEVTAHPLLDLLDDPNPEFDRPSLLHFISICLDVVGTAYLLPEGGGPALPPAELWPLPPADVHAERSGTSAIPAAYTYAGRRIPIEELIRFRLAGLRDPYGDGYPPAQAAFAYSNLEEVWVTTRDQLLRRGPKPSALVGPADAKMPWGPDETRRLQAELDRQHAGPAGGGIVVAGTGYTYTPTSHKPTDLGDAIGPEALQAIANVFGVPISFLTAATNLANLQAAELQHGRRAIGPRCTRIAAVLTRWARRFDPRLFFAFDDCCPEDEQRRSQIHERYLKAKVLAVNEVRGELGWEPVAWGDEPWMPAGERQPSEERPEPPPPPGAGPKPSGPPEVDDDDPDDDDDEEAVAAKAMLAEATAVLRDIKGRLSADEPDDDDPRDYDGDGCCGDRGRGRDAGDPPGGGEGEGEEEDAAHGRGEHLRPADGQGDREDAQAVVPDPGEGDPGGPADGTDGPAA
jgi:phage portal protein BeeE